MPRKFKSGPSSIIRKTQVPNARARPLQAAAPRGSRLPVNLEAEARGFRLNSDKLREIMMEGAHY